MGAPAMGARASWRLSLMQLGLMILGVRSQNLTACQALSSALPDQVFWPASVQYLDESHDVWSQTCVMTPTCVFEPSNVQALSQGLGLIYQANVSFAFRAGGHMPVPGAQSLNDGVMISASMLNSKVLSADGSIASVGPGQTWIEVYQWLSPFGLAVNGGRFPSVGVGGVLVGGGMGFFSGSQGWAVDNIVGWQVVLWNGTVLELTNSPQDPYADLVWGLKGGSNLFGLVTRFDLRTFPVTSAFGGLTIWSSAAGPNVLAALTSYMAPGGGVDDPLVHIDVFSGLSFNNGVPSLQYYNIALYPGTNANPTALENFTAIPADLTVANGVAVHPDWTAIPQQLSPFSSKASRNLFYSISFQGTPESIAVFNKTVIDYAVKKLSQVQGLTTFVVYQPVSKGYLQASKDKGGSNVLGLDPDLDGTFIGEFAFLQTGRPVILISATAGIILSMWENASDDAAMLAYSDTAHRLVREQTQTLGTYKRFMYLGDSAQGQLPWHNYNNGTNRRTLLRLQEKYDPLSFFAQNLHRGFPL
ncbi:FAD-binding domain-containing protein [Xylariaceae sp. FL0594]|nr:FAD-binding domain-containing protein [Xylariaceae sp. FL0594]